ncbi:septum formation protein Maf [Candidatus Bathyarchaeota archaeon]|nr:septum formation protein Maf [Candidatus Bathyarchaeota archaeon]
MTTPIIVLASTSKRRIKMMKQIGVKCKIVDPGDSENSNSLIPDVRVKENSYNKALGVAKKEKDSLIIAADTIVIFDGKIFEKPKNLEDAKMMLTQLGGKTHKVITGITIINSSNMQEWYDFEVTYVSMKKLTKIEIEHYILTGEPMDKAGAYAAQDIGALLIERIDGCYFNVVGLPLSKLFEMFKKIGFNILINTKKKL